MHLCPHTERNCNEFLMHFAVQNLHSFGPYFTFCTLLGLISMQPCTLENSSETSLWAISVLLSEKFFILLFCAQFYSNQQQFIQILFTFLTALHKLYVLCSFKFVNFFKWRYLPVESLDEGGDVDSGNSTSHSPEDSFRWLLAFLTVFDILIKQVTQNTFLEFEMWPKLSFIESVL